MSASLFSDVYVDMLLVWSKIKCEKVCKIFSKFMLYLGVGAKLDVTGLNVVRDDIDYSIEAV